MKNPLQFFFLNGGGGAFELEPWPNYYPNKKGESAGGEWGPPN
jgi:hypothetical protein